MDGWDCDVCVWIYDREGRRENYRTFLSRAILLKSWLKRRNKTPPIIIEVIYPEHRAIIVIITT